MYLINTHIEIIVILFQAELVDMRADLIQAKAACAG